MNEIITRSPESLIVPSPRSPITTRVATMADLPFLDALQKQHSKQLGFFPRAQMEGYVENQWILIAEDAATGTRLGYCASRDRYLKRDELGVIYQLCVTPGHQRGLIGATLIKAVFERSAYGCRLYCCWCAQDLAANYFWESLGFVPIAFRAGSTGKKRVHIFWQRRIDRELPITDCQLPNESDSNRKSQMGNRQSPAPYWYPCQTNGGAIREDRLVFPIPPGTHWTEVQPVAARARARARGALPVEGGPLSVKKERRKGSVGVSPAKGNAQPATISAGGLFFAPPKRVKERAGRVRPEKVKGKVDPKLVATARELRDRYLEYVNGEHVNDRLLVAPRGKYEVSRALTARDVKPEARRIAA